MEVIVTVVVFVVFGAFIYWQVKRSKAGKATPGYRPPRPGDDHPSKDI